jgi:hypothetical protein
MPSKKKPAKSKNKKKAAGTKKKNAAVLDRR